MPGNTLPCQPLPHRLRRSESQTSLTRPNQSIHGNAFRTPFMRQPTDSASPTAAAPRWRLSLPLPRSIQPTPPATATCHPDVSSANPLRYPLWSMRIPTPLTNRPTAAAMLPASATIPPAHLTPARSFHLRMHRKHTDCYRSLYRRRYQWYHLRSISDRVYHHNHQQNSHQHSPHSLIRDRRRLWPCYYEQENWRETATPTPSEEKKIHCNPDHRIFFFRYMKFAYNMADVPLSALRRRVLLSVAVVKRLGRSCRSRDQIIFGHRPH